MVAVRLKKNKVCGGGGGGGGGELRFGARRPQQCLQWSPLRLELAAQLVQVLPELGERHVCRELRLHPLDLVVELAAELVEPRRPSGHRLRLRGLDQHPPPSAAKEELLPPGSPPSAWRRARTAHSATRAVHTYGSFFVSTEHTNYVFWVPLISTSS